MAHIQVPPGVPGIRSLFLTRLETARPMCEMCEVLLAGPSTLSRGERELIASYVSATNGCVFCATCHSAVASELLDGNEELVVQVTTDFTKAAISPKLKALLNIAGKVAKDARTVSEEDIAAARTKGADDREIHDTVLIAAMFCMFNRYVDGLRAWTPTEAGPYREIAKRLAREGYATIPGLHVPDKSAPKKRA
jgi:uncharacterized peroxidase-related enzyme